MTSAPDIDIDLERAIAGLYSGALDTFIASRDDLAKRLRAIKRRDDAASVKALRKPSRAAWALDQAAASETDMRQLVAAVTATLQAQGVGGDVRAAITELRNAIRIFAGRAAALAQDAGHGLDASALATALLAVLADPVSFELLRTARLTDVPEAGGLDFLSALPAPPPMPVAAAEPPVRAPAAEPAAHRGTAAEKKAATRAAETAAAALEVARRQSEEADVALERAAAMHDDAEAELRRAEEQARVARSAHEEACAAADSARHALHEAEAKAAEARRRLASL